MQPLYYVGAKNASPDAHIGINPLLRDNLLRTFYNTIDKLGNYGRNLARYNANMGVGARVPYAAFPHVDNS